MAELHVSIFDYCMSFCCISTDDNDLKEFDYERYVMEEVELRRIVDNPAMSMVRSPVYCFYFSHATFLM